MSFGHIHALWNHQHNHEDKQVPSLFVSTFDIILDLGLFFLTVTTVFVLFRFLRYHVICPVRRPTFLYLVKCILVASLNMPLYPICHINWYLDLEAWFNSDSVFQAKHISYWVASHQEARKCLVVSIRITKIQLVSTDPSITEFSISLSPCGFSTTDDGCPDPLAH